MLAQGAGLSPEFGAAGGHRLAASGRFVRDLGHAANGRGDLAGVCGLLSGGGRNFGYFGRRGLCRLNNMRQGRGGMVTKLHAFHHPLRGLLDQRQDFPASQIGTLGQLADLVGDDGKAHAVLAGSGGLNGRVERQEVRLAGDLEITRIISPICVEPARISSMDSVDLRTAEPPSCGESIRLPGQLVGFTGVFFDGFDGAGKFLYRGCHSLDAGALRARDVGESLRAHGNVAGSFMEACGDFADLADYGRQVLEHFPHAGGQLVTGSSPSTRTSRVRSPWAAARTTSSRRSTFLRMVSPAFLSAATR